MMYDDEDKALERYAVRTTHPLLALWSVILGVILIIAVIAGFIATWPHFVEGAQSVMDQLIWIAVIVIPAAVVIAIVGYATHLVLHMRRKHLIEEIEIEHARMVAETEVERLRAEADLIQAEADKKRMFHDLDVQGNKLFFNPLTGQVQYIGGNMREHPALHTYHNAPKYAVTEATQQAQLPAASSIPLPKIEMFYEAIPHNGLYTALGIEAATGKPILAPIRQSTHFKLIGGSGQGKSCVAGAIIDVATTTNDPDHLRIGLLDLEHNTSRLFEDLPHIAEIGPRRQRLVGRDADEVAMKLKLLQWELKRRSDQGEEYCTTHEPILLVYVEEMLALKYEVVDKKLRQEMLAAINILGVRGRKYGIFFLACMQTDYSDKSTREAMAQFRTRGGFAIDPDTARASGFFNTELIKENFQAGRQGQYVLEKPQYSGIALAPDYDVAAKLQATSAPTSGLGPIPFTDGGRSAALQPVVVDAEAAPEVAQPSPLRSAPQADVSHFSSQEKRIIHKFMDEGMNLSQLVASEFTNSNGAPLSGGEAFKQKSKEVQDILRRYFHQQEAS